MELKVNTSKVISFTEYKVKERKHRRLRECEHLRIMLDEEAIRCECEDCGAVIHPFWILVEYMQRARDHKRETGALNAAIAEFNKIKAGWSLTITEKRRIAKAMNEGRRG